MLEILGLFGILLAGAAVLLVLTLLFSLFKIGFKLILIPMALVVGILKFGLIACLVVAAVVVAPVLLTIFAVALPFVLLAGLCSLGWAIIA